MKPMRNAVHLLLLAGWTLVGAAFTLHSLGSPDAHGLGLLAVGAYWLWLVGFAALTSVLIVRFATPLAVLAVHAGTLLVLAAMPHAFPASLLRVGLDVLRGA
jgi:hypothetical protein